MILIVLIVSGMASLLSKLYGMHLESGGELWIPQLHLNISQRANIDPYQDTSFISTQEALRYLNVTNETVNGRWSNTGKLATTSVMFLKTHKTGSSTLQNIFFRFAVSRGLEVALPAYLSSFLYPTLNFHHTLVLQNTSINAPCCDFVLHHLVMDSEEIRKVVRPTAAWVTILRNPISLFISSYQYYNVSRCTKGRTLITLDLDKYRDLNTSKCQAIRMQIANMQAYDLGIKAYGYKGCAIDTFIKDVDQIFDVVLINEMYDESLIVMMHKLHWSFYDIIHLRHNMQHQKNSTSSVIKMLPERQLRKIEEYNTADKRLYEHFRSKMIQQISQLEEAGVNITDEVIQLRQLNKRVYSKCVAETVPSSSLRGVQDLKMFAGYSSSYAYRLREERINDLMCRSLALPELSYDRYLKGMSPSKGNKFAPITRSKLLAKVSEALAKTRRKSKRPCHKNT